jgi:ankyrin repeat protein
VNSRLILLILIIFSTQAHAIKRKIVLHNQTKTQQTEPFDYVSLVPDIQKIVIDFSTNNTTAKTVKEAAQTINALAQTNKKFNILINEPLFSKNLIKNLAIKFDCSHETIAKSLCTQQTKQQLKLQYKLKNLCYTQRNVLPTQLSEFIAQHVDLDFTYNDDLSNKTLLMMSIRRAKNDIFNFLITEGANINNCNTNGLTALALTTEWKIHASYLTQILSHPQLTINQQDKNGTSALLHCLMSRKSHPITSTFIITVKKLLDAGADPELANNDGLTPLIAAQDLGNNQLITIITKAIEEKHYSMQ